MPVNTAAFAEVEITPPPGTRKIGAIIEVVGRRVHDPLFGRVCVLTSDEETLAIIQLDVLSVSRRHVGEIRRAIEARYGYPGGHVMVAATHTHAGPATVRLGEVEADAEYAKSLSARVVEAFGEALGAPQPAQISTATHRVFGIAHNRRIVQRDGTVRTHGLLSSPDALFTEGPVDHDLTAIIVSDDRGRPLGALVNFACHPTHHVFDDGFSAGWPGVVARVLREHGIPMTLVLNGALGNVHTIDPRHGVEADMYGVGRALAAPVAAQLDAGLDPQPFALAVDGSWLALPFRKPGAEELAGTIRGAQRDNDPSVYERMMPQLLNEFEAEGTQQAEIQVLSIGENVLVGVPGELFAELGLRIKETSYPQRALTVGPANGMVGYLPHQEAFARGGYETTLYNGSKLAPEAGEILASEASRLVNRVSA